MSEASKYSYASSTSLEPARFTERIAEQQEVPRIFYAFVCWAHWAGHIFKTVLEFMVIEFS